jgi:hypothetical protein
MMVRRWLCFLARRSATKHARPRQMVVIRSAGEKENSGRARIIPVPKASVTWMTRKDGENRLFKVLLAILKNPLLFRKRVFKVSL